MRFIPEIKAHCMCVIIASTTLCSNAGANSIEILVDASLDESSLQTAGEVALSIAQSAGQDHSVGLVIYDEVFQRSTDRMDADGIQAQHISDALSKITLSKFSNIAVGIEKGISELKSDGGVLLVLGHSDIRLADIEAVSKYRDWLQFVLLPDASSKSISIILASPKSTQPNVLDSIIQEYPNNSVIYYIDTSDAIDQLSVLLPFQLSNNTLTARVEQVDVTVLPSLPLSLPVPVPVQTQILDADPAVAIAIPIATDIATQSEQQGAIGWKNFILLVMTMLIFITVAVTWLLLKRRRKSKNERLDDTLELATQPGRSRYLAPQQDLAAILTTRATEEDVVPAAVRLQSDALQSDPNWDVFDKLLVTVPELPSDEFWFDPDITARHEPVESDIPTQNVDPDATVRQKAILPDMTSSSHKEGAVDELEELRNLTEQKQLSQL